MTPSQPIQPPCKCDGYPASFKQQFGYDCPDHTPPPATGEADYSYKNISGSRGVRINTFKGEPDELLRQRFHRAVDDEFPEALPNESSPQVQGEPLPIAEGADPPGEIKDGSWAVEYSTDPLNAKSPEGLEAQQSGSHKSVEQANSTTADPLSERVLSILGELVVGTVAIADNDKVDAMDIQVSACVQILALIREEAERELHHTEPTKRHDGR